MNRYLDMEDGDEPYLDGIKYHAMPPLKRFRDMEHLSGGEKTMAALALLFAVHSYQPSPFFVLDEVDAALDNANVAKIASYIRDHAGPGMQFIVISLKTGLFQGSEALVGIYRDQGANSSKALTLDVSSPLSSHLLREIADANSVVAQVPMIGSATLFLSICLPQNFSSSVAVEVVSSISTHNMDDGRATCIGVLRILKCTIPDDVHSEWTMVLATCENT